MTGRGMADHVEATLGLAEKILKSAKRCVPNGDRDAPCRWYRSSSLSFQPDLDQTADRLGGASFLFPLSSLEFALDGIADELGHFLLADQRLNPFQRFFRKPDDGRFYV